MKKQIFCISIILLVSLGTYAQNADKTVEQIRKVYDDAAQKARLAETDTDRGETGEMVMNELTINKRNHQWRAVGIYRQTYKFFYTGGNSEEHLYPDQLVMVKVERKVSDRTYQEEYLFSESGSLLFYYQKADNDKLVPAERRVYFNGVRPVRLIEDGKTRDSLQIRSSAAIRDILGASVRVRELFQKSIKL